MKDEIKEILEYVLSITYGNENAINGINKVEDYINNLQDTLKDREEYCYGLETQITNLQEENEKAIEYIEKYQEVLKEHNGDWLNYQDGFKPYLLNILQGEDKDE